LNITFVITDQQELHEGVVRPFVNFAKALEGKFQFSFLLLNCSQQFLENLGKHGFRVILCKNKKNMIQQIAQINPEFVFTDDDLKRLKLVQEIKIAIKAKAISYVQILYGSHSIANCFDQSSLNFKQKLVFNPMRYVPFSFFSSRYSKLLKTFDLIIANSKITATFLHSLYNVEVSAIVYPSINTEIFQPSSEKAKEITIYLGSHLGDANADFIKRIVRSVVENGYVANLFGNAKIGSEIIREGEGNKSVLYHPNLTDIELSKMYSRSKLTICPQKWEQFGLVPVESLSCGTPVLAFNCMGFQETIDKTTGWLANNSDEFLEILHEDLKKEGPSVQELRTIAVKEFSITSSGTALMNLLEKYFNQKI
jgi:glycosyltransferase involved in cell wall biosynthesis